MPLRPARIRHDDPGGRDAFLRYAGRVYPRAGFRAWMERGGWTPPYEAHALVDGGEIVANVSVMRTPVVLEGRALRGAQLGAVGCVPEWRGRGLMRSLLEHALALLDADTDVLFLYANERVLDLYPRFGFRREQESEFELDLVVRPAPRVAPVVDLEDPRQRAAWLDAYAASPAPTGRFGVRDYGSAALWHVGSFGHPVYALVEGSAYAVAVQRGDTLHLLDVVAPGGFDLRDAIPALVRAPIARVRFGFCPERWFPEARVAGPSDDALFVRGALAVPSAPFQLPELAQT